MGVSGCCYVFVVRLYVHGYLWLIRPSAWLVSLYIILSLLHCSGVCFRVSVGSVFLSTHSALLLISHFSSSPLFCSSCSAFYRRRRAAREAEESPAQPAPVSVTLHSSAYFTAFLLFSRQLLPCQ